MKAPKIILAIWSAAALAVTASGIYNDVPAPAIQGTIAGLTLALVLCWVISKPFCAWTLSLNLRALVLFQCWRVIPGSMFLYYYYELGKLPFQFAVVGGIGDILVGITAPLAAILADARSTAKLRALMVWQVFALFDLLMVIRAGLVNGLHDPQSMMPLTHFPLSLLPTLLVPLTLFVHLITMAQIRQTLVAKAPALNGRQ
ncbi:MAG: hypothetical protein JWO13_3277 [Acidobacteriales bacterium]|nr:hypothetical protein [Terriglobales bacterium]